MDVVVVAEARVSGEARRRALVATVHGHEVDVHVDDQVALGGPAAELHVFAVGCLAEYHHAVGILGVVVVEASVGGEGVVHPVADSVPELVLGHAAVDGQGGDEVDVVYAGLGGEVQHRFDDPLTDVGAAHRGGREGDVVEGDRELHVGVQQGAERLGIAEGVVEGVADGAVGVGQALEGFGRVDDPGAPGWQLLQSEALTVVEHDGRAVPVDVEDEAGSGGEVTSVAHRSLRSFS